MSWLQVSAGEAHGDKQLHEASHTRDKNALIYSCSHAERCKVHHILPSSWSSYYNPLLYVLRKRGKVVTGRALCLHPSAGVVRV